MAITIYYHADCLDGFAAAYAAWRKFGDRARYRPMHHGDTWQQDDVAGHEVYILDFSFPPDTLCDMAAIAQQVTQLDHHVTARQPWAAQLRAGDAHETFVAADRPLRLIFDLERAGAHLAWAHFHPGTPLPRALAHVEDIDLWRFALPDTRAFCRALRLLPWDFATWDPIVQDSVSGGARYQALIAQGQAIEQFLDREIDRLANSRLLTPVTLRGEPIDPLQAVRHGLPVIEDEDGCWRAQRGIAINASSLFASELGHRLVERHGGFALIWEMTGEQVARVSLRAAGAVNVAQIAENYGGGGHPNAAGFRLPVRQLLACLG